MTVYNGMPFLVSTIESILGQTFEDFEFIIVDDGSNDESNSYLSSLDDPRITVIKQENGGTAAAANHGLTYCRGDYTARMDADDISTPNRFERQVDFLDKHADIGLVGSYTTLLGETRLGTVVALPTSHEDIVEALLAGRHALSHPSLMMRTQLLKDIGGYWPFRLIDDWDMMLRMSEVTQVANLDEPLLQYRVHRRSLNGKNMDAMRFSIDFARARAAARRAGQPEPDLDRFTAERADRPVKERIGSWAESRSLAHYRLATAEWTGPRRWIALPHMVLAVAVRPDFLVRRVSRQLKA